MKYSLPLIVAAVFLLGATAVSSAPPETDGLLSKTAGSLMQMHKRAKKALVNAAQDKSYVEFLQASGEHRHALRQRVDAVSLKVQKRFHVEEMCLISADGPELNRIVGSQVANDLSEDESGAVFFGPGFAQRPRTVHVSTLYMSPDADKWVLAYVTPVVVDGEKKAILHYEHGLDAFQARISKGVSGDKLFVQAVSEDGFVVADSRRTIAVSKNGDKEDPADYFARFDMGGGDLERVAATLNGGGTITDGSGKSFVGAARKVERWTLLVLSPAG